MFANGDESATVVPLGSSKCQQPTGTSVASHVATRFAAMLSRKWLSGVSATLSPGAGAGPPPVSTLTAMSSDELEVNRAQRSIASVWLMMPSRSPACTAIGVIGVTIGAPGSELPSVSASLLTPTTM